MRKRIYEIIEKAAFEDHLSRVYDIVLIAAIIVSLIPLTFKHELWWFRITDKVTVVIFIIDYILRLITADYKYGNHSWKSFVRYPFSPMALIDLISILPSLTIMNNLFKLLRTFRLLRTISLVRATRVTKTIRVLKTVRYSRSASIFNRIVRESRNALTVVMLFVISYIFLTALIVFNLEPQVFRHFVDALYWSTLTLTTVGYGDIVPQTLVGKLITMCSSFVGIAVIALPSGIFSASYITILNREREQERERKRRQGRERGREDASDNDRSDSES